MLAANDMGKRVEILDTEWPRPWDVLSVHEISLILKQPTMTPAPPKRLRATKASDKAKKAEEFAAHIGRELRVMFDDVVSEPVPDRFQKLLDELEQKKPK